MALGDPYATPAEYRAAVGKNNSTSDDQIAQQLVMASEWWARKLRRNLGFQQASTASARLYRVARGPNGCGSQYLNVDDIASASGLAVKFDTDDDGSFDDEDEVDASCYEARPLNALTDSEPYDQLFYKSTSGWPLDCLIQVTAVWGWPAVPQAIKEATIEWVAVWRMESPRATSRVNELDQVESVSPYHLSMVKRLTEIYALPRRPRAA